MNALERFVRKVEMDLESGCWRWTGAVASHGYGSFKVRGKTWMAHRFSLSEFENVALPAGKYVCHRCDNPLCVRPDHLFVGSSRDNALDRNAKRRHGAVTMPHRQVRGAAHPAAKLATTQVLLIRFLSEGGASQRTIAEAFGISQGHVSDIVNFRLWKQQHNHGGSK